MTQKINAVNTNNNALIFLFECKDLNENDCNLTANKIESEGNKKR
tara:strand:+ start:737 stop:871 length:135 start_codon:yes stop_codon:yes gene_type:complete